MSHLIVSQGGKDKRFDLVEQFVFIGKSPDCGVRVQSEVARDRECQVLNVAGSFRLVHLGGGAGTFLNGVQVQQAELKDGDLVSIGDTVIKFCSPPAPAAPTRARTKREGEVNRRERAVKGLTKAQKTLISMSGTLLVLILVWVIWDNRKKADIAQTQFEKGEKAEGNQNWDAALDAYRAILDGASNYEQAQARIKDIESMLAERKKSAVVADAHRDYVSNIDAFISRWLTPDDPNGKLDPSAVRYFVKRCEKFIATYPTHEDATRVKDLLAKYKAMVPAGEPTWRDAEFEATREKDRSQYGAAVKAIDAWAAANPNDKASKPAADIMRRQIVDYAKTQWDRYQDRAKPFIKDGNIAQAASLYQTAITAFDGIADLHEAAKRALAELTKDVTIRNP